MTLTAFKNVCILKLRSAPKKSGWVRGEEGRAPSGSVWNDKKHARQLGLNPELDHIHHVYGFPFQITFTVGQCFRRARGLSMTSVRGYRADKRVWENRLKEKRGGNKRGWRLVLGMIYRSKCVFKLSSYVDTSVVKTYKVLCKSVLRKSLPVPYNWWSE